MGDIADYEYERELEAFFGFEGDFVDPYKDDTEGMLVFPDDNDKDQDER